MININITVIKIGYFLLQITTIVKSLPVTLYEGDDCRMKNSTTGECRKDVDCPTFNVNREVKTFLHNWKEFYNLCGFDGVTPILCCPDRTKPRKSVLHCEIYNEITESFTPTRRQIFGGDLAGIGEFPHMAAIGRFEDSTNKINIICGGSLISNLFILTAAHCVQRRRDIGWNIDVVKLGGIDLNTNSPTYGVEIIVVHPQYNHLLKYNDIALIRLNRSVDNFSGYLHPACLYTENNNPASPLTITGWGQRNLSESSRSPLLLKANLDPVSNNNCSNVFNYINEAAGLSNDISDQQLCAQSFNKLDTCKGDSGGPIQVKSVHPNMWNIVGITSFGRVCGEEVPSVYTRVYSYLDWIESIVWPN